MRSFWLEQALDAEPASPVPLDHDLSTDVCIVGGGFTGLWTALEIKRRDRSVDVTVIEADLCGSGASGRNGGFAMTWMSKAATLLEICGGQEGVRLLRASEDAVRAIGAFCDSHGLGAHFRQHGWLWTASNRRQIGAWQSTLDVLARHGLEPFDVLAPAQVAALGGSERHLAGVFEGSVATVQPALLARTLARVASEQGVHIYERTAMTGLQGGARPVVRTREARVTAEAVVLALNAWAHELPVFRRSILPIASDVVMTRPVPDRLHAVGLDTGIAISDSRMLVNYYRSTPDGRLCFGKGGGAIPFAGRLGRRFDDASPRREAIAREIGRFYPTLADAGIAAAWRGPATRTATGLPHFGRMPGAAAIVYGHGYTGNGVGPSHVGGQFLASLALGARDEWSQSPMVERRPARFLPPEPVRYAGGQLVRAAVGRKEAAEDAGREPGRLDTALAGLAPSGLAPVRKP
ncbi:MAG: FAD-dependent oxidoreductase [Gammaproteobacteria bacterium]|nr:FAD-dependent oxidoreductase [Gammaproteobacteria bacterium]NIM74187.1 FAD-dependent oxidoreductase [Gammaproteobacteria bacterium]NIN39486.1 FAD-dependent oxidoreductase [Gammaproteobacteria bacterium]NIO25959.1 FAD-dependent oxidoreductase [Gammaproteobacteria bacterium]NIO66592.1 FAD-dependent oxidoreductase [Gammaproteobacteria bacterium]